jgi:hypothetical protein
MTRNNTSRAPNVTTGTEVLQYAPVVGLWNTTDLALSFVTVTMIYGGSGYTNDVVNFSANGKGAMAQVTMNMNNTVITGVTVTDGGSGYTVPPAVTFTDAIGGRAKGIATVDSNGAVIGVTVTEGGYYGGFGTPQVSFNAGSGATAKANISNGVIKSISMIKGGFGYTSPPIISFSETVVEPAKAIAILNPVLIVNGALDEFLS